MIRSHISAGQVLREGRYSLSDEECEQLDRGQLFTSESTVALLRTAVLRAAAEAREEKSRLFSDVFPLQNSDGSDLGHVALVVRSWNFENLAGIGR